MKEGDEQGSSALPPSKRLRLSIHRNNNNAPRGSNSHSQDPELPPHIASSSSAQFGIRAETRAPKEDYFVHCSQIQSHPGTTNNPEDLCRVTDTRALCASLRQPSEADDHASRALHDPLDGVDNHEEEYRGGRSPIRGLRPGVRTSQSTEEVEAENLREINTRVLLSESHNEAVRVNEMGADGAPLLGPEALQGSPNVVLHQQQEANVNSCSEDAGLDVGGHVPRQQDETVPTNAATIRPPGSPADVPDAEALEVDDAHGSSGATTSAGAHAHGVVEVVELSEDDNDNGEGALAQEAPILTASAFAEPEHTPEDHDAFAPEPCLPPHPPTPEGATAEVETSKPEQFGTQLESEGMMCPICMEPWTSTGSHRICSLACGHLFGKSCIKRWLRQAGRKQGKCPHCNRRARVEDLRTLYIPRLTVVDDESQRYMQEVGLLRTENEQLKRQVEDLQEEVRRSQALLSALHIEQRDAFSSFDSFQQPRGLPSRPMSENRQHRIMHKASGPGSHPHQEAHGNLRHFLIIPPQHRGGPPKSATPEHLLCATRSVDDSVASRRVLQERHNWRGLDAGGAARNGAGMMEEFRRRREGLAARPLRSFSSLASIGSRGLQNNFVLQDEVPLHGAKVFDMDAHSQLLLVSGKPADKMASSGLTKMSLLALSEGECMDLPPGTGAVRDIRIAPAGTQSPGRLALVASLGKKLTVFSLESNNVVITYSLQSPSWACAWDPCDPNQVYTGLQNGSLLIFDMRQTSSPLATLKGPSSTPIHTLQYVPEKGRLHPDAAAAQEGRGLLSASSSALLFWPGIDQPEELRPVCLSQPGSSSVCVSLAYNAAVDVAVASFRPKPIPIPSNEGTSSSTPPAAPSSQTDVTSQPATSAPPTDVAPSTASVGVHIPTHFSYVRSRWRPSSDRAGDSAAPAADAWWQRRGAMVGHKSQSGLPRSAMVSEWRSGQSPLQSGAEEQRCLFASGDEGSNSVWIWELGNPTARQTLVPHPSPVLDVRSAHVAGMDLLGCISERTLQLYRRLPA